MVGAVWGCLGKQVVNAAVRHHGGVLPAAQTGASVHTLVHSVRLAAADQKDVLEEVKGLGEGCATP